MGFGSGVLSSFLYDFLHALFKLRGRPGLRAKWEHRTNRTVDGSELCVSATISKGRTQLMTKNRGGGGKPGACDGISALQVLTALTLSDTPMLF